MTEIVAWYRRYRPAGFKELVGQDHIKKAVLGAMKANSISHAYLFCGPRGTGKTTMARLVAKALICIKPGKDNIPCGKCERCKEVGSSRLVDVLEIDAASNRGIDEIRDLREKIAYMPTIAKKKVYIIDEVHMLTKEAFNALLKILEEPPAHAHFILATTEAHKVPATIISRCQRFDFRRLPNKEIVSRLEHIVKSEKIKVEVEALYLIAQLADGSLRDAISLTEQLSYTGKLTLKSVKEGAGLVDQHLIEHWHELVSKEDLSAAIAFVEQLYQDGVNLAQFTQSVVGSLRERLLMQVSKNAYDDAATTLRHINVLEKANKALKTAFLPQLPLEQAIINLITEDVIFEKADKAQVTLAKIAVEEYQDDESRHDDKKSDSSVCGSDSCHSKPDATKAAKSQRGSKKLKIDEVIENWDKVIDKLKLNTTKFSLMSAKPQSILLNNNLLVAVDSEFNKHKLEDAQQKYDFEEALREVFQQKVDVEFRAVAHEQTETLDVTTAVTAKNQGKDRNGAVKENENEEKLAAEIADIFGGEIL